MDTQGPSTFKASPNQIVCSRLVLDQPYLASLHHQSLELSSRTAQSNSPGDVTHPVHQRNLQLNVLRAIMTSLLHSTPVKTSSRPILTGLRVLVDSLGHITSPPVMMSNLCYMHPESVQSLCDPWCMRN